MATLHTAAPVLASLDMRATLDYYRDILGFSIEYDDPGYGMVKRDSIGIHFWKCQDKIFPEHTSCYIYVDGVDQLYAEYLPKGIIHPNAPLENKPWGMREFAILDLFGNLIRFGQMSVRSES